MQGSRSNGKSLVIVGLVLLLAVLAYWLIADTFFTVGLFIAIGIAVGGLILSMNDRKRLPDEPGNGRGDPSGRLS